MRKGEIFTLRFENVYLDEGYLYVEKSKSGRSRKIPMNEETKNIFKQIFSTRGNQKYVFENPRTKKHFVDIKHSFTKVLEKADIKDFTFHSLRHTFATYAILNGSDIYNLSKILGHASLATTLRYLSATSDGLQKVVNSIKIGEKKITSIELPFPKAG